LELVLLSPQPEALWLEHMHGAGVAQAELTDRDAVIRATHGAEALFWTLPPDYIADDFLAFQRRIAEAGAEAVRANRIRNVVLISGLGAQLQVPGAPFEALRYAEDLMQTVADNLTVLRPGYYMENYCFQLDSIHAVRSVFLPISPEARTPMVAAHDVALAAAAALLEPTPRQTLDLLGPREYSFAEAAAIVGRAVGRRVKHVAITRMQAREFLVGYGASADVAESILRMYEVIEDGRLQVPAGQRSPEMTPTTLHQFASDVLAPALDAMASAS
jgi:uncharacterized protein YbjT (DUF2867 family)